MDQVLFAFFMPGYSEDIKYGACLGDLKVDGPLRSVEYARNH